VALELPRADGSNIIGTATSIPVSVEDGGGELMIEPPLGRARLNACGSAPSPCIEHLNSTALAEYLFINLNTWVCSPPKNTLNFMLFSAEPADAIQCSLNSKTPICGELKTRGTTESKISKGVNIISTSAFAHGEISINGGTETACNEHEDDKCARVALGFLNESVLVNDFLTVVEKVIVSTTEDRVELTIIL
jgi:hypothetical protein